MSSTEQAEKLAIQRRYQADMREIWIMQPRLEKRGRQAWRLIEHLRFRAGYDFLLLRCDAGELPAEVGRWWTRVHRRATPPRAKQLLEAADGGSGQAARKRRRRRSRGGRDRAGRGSQQPATTQTGRATTMTGRATHDDGSATTRPRTTTRPARRRPRCAPATGCATAPSARRRRGPDRRRRSGPGAR